MRRLSRDNLLALKRNVDAALEEKASQLAYDNSVLGDT
jgi:hypothetical protein